MCNQDLREKTYICPKCKTGKLVEKSGRKGNFLACNNFPKCKNIVRNIPTGENCELCDSEMVIRTGKYGLFVACSGYPKCKNIWRDGKSPVDNLVAIAKNFIPSELQKKINDFIHNSRKNLIVGATAGSGKTSTIQYILQSYKLPYAYLVFNRKNAKEAQQKLSGEVKTIHSYTMKVLSGMGYKFDAKKYSDVIYSYLPYETGNKQTEQENRILRAMVYKTLTRIFQTLTDNNVKVIEQVVRDLGIAEKHVNLVVNYVHNILKQTAKIKTFTMGDLFYLFYVDSLDVTNKVNTLFVDECQDVSQDQMFAISLFAERFIFVGDNWQAIYIWRGAMSNAIQVLKDYFDAEILPLDESFRVPSVHSEYINTIFPDIIKSRKTGGELSFYGDLSEVENLSGSLLLSRRNAPLFGIALNCLKNGQDFDLVGKEDLQDKLLEIAQYCYADNLQDFNTNLQKWADSQKVYIPESDDNALKEVDDFVAIMQDFTIGLYDISQLSNRIIELLEKSKSSDSAVRLSTIHKAKGLESDSVIIIDYDNLTLPEYSPTDDPTIQENYNLLFVALSRSKDKMFIVK